MAGNTDSVAGFGLGFKLALAAATLAAAALAAEAVPAALDWGHTGFWNDLRLARVIAIARGYDLYSAAAEGPQTGLIYGPLGFWTLAPAALFPTPSSAMACAVLLTAALWLVPAALLLARAGGPPAWRLAAFLFVFFHLRWTDAAGTLWNVHVDGPALFWGGLAAHFLAVAGERREGGWPLAAAAFCAASASWSKQTMAPLLLAPAAWMLFLGRRGDAARALGLTIASGAGWGALFGSIYGFEDLFHTMFRLPASHAVHPGRVLADSGLVGEAFDLVALAGIVVVCRAASGADRARFDPALRGARLPLALAAALLPTALLGRMKADGGANNYFAVEYFLALGAAIALASLRPRDLSSIRLGRAAVALVAAMLALQGARAGAYAIHRAHARWLERSERPAETAYLWARERPGEAYFPWNPTGALLANGRLDHTGYALETWRLAGKPIPRGRFRAYTPPGMRYLIEPPVPLPDYSPVLPEFRRPAALPGMERWRVLTRE